MSKSLRKQTSPVKVIVVSASSRALVQSIDRAGLEVFSIDQFTDFDTARIAQTVCFGELGVWPFSPDAFENWVSRNYRVGTFSELDEVFCIYSGGLENHPALVDEMQRSARLLGNPGSTLRKLQDTFSLHTWLRDCGFLVPQSYSIAQFQQLQQEDREKFAHGRDYLRKKHRSCGGLGIIRFRPDLDDSFSPSLSANQQEASEKEYYFQEYLDGQVLSACYVTSAGSQTTATKNTSLLGITQQLSGDERFNAGDFIYTGSLTVPEPDESMIEFAQATGSRLAEEFQLIGLFNVDFIQFKNQFYFLEINPRYSASMELLEKQSGFNFFDLHMKACLGQPIPETSSQFFVSSSSSPRKEFNSEKRIEAKRIEGKAIWFANRDLHIPNNFSERAIEQTDPKGNPLIADIPQPQTRIERGSPVFTVFANSDSTDNLSGGSNDQVTEKLLETAKMFDSLLSD